MSDLVKQLRAWHTPGETITGDVQLYLDAADRIEQLEKHKRLQMEDVMNLGAQLGQAWLRIEQLEAALREIDEAVLAEREACAAIAAKRPHHSGIEIAELIHARADVYPGFRGNNEA